METVNTPEKVRDEIMNERVDGLAKDYMGKVKSNIKRALDEEKTTCTIELPPYRRPHVGYPEEGKGNITEKALNRVVHSLGSPYEVSIREVAPIRPFRELYLQSLGEGRRYPNSFGYELTLSW